MVARQPEPCLSGEVEFEVAEAINLMLTVLWKQVNKEAQEEYNRLLAADIPF